ncbi:MAG: hypothetical protein FWC77_01785 [Defluviitaleaceae bacterium]|nr:hypothetical protein [Defluviitaleaceae bacterium]
MKNLKFVGGILLVATALVFVFLAVFFPYNGMFTMLWNAGLFTFRGDPSLVIVYIASALSFVVGLYLLATHIKSHKGEA